EIEMPAPVVAEPANVFLDRVDVLLLLLDRVGVVEAQVAAPAVLLGDPEVERDRLGVTDMEVAVRLGREGGYDLRDAAVAQVGGDAVADEIASLGCCWIVGGHAVLLIISKAQRRAVQPGAATRTQRRCENRGSRRKAPRRDASRASSVPPSS